jgi:hypothetical protein
MPLILTTNAVLTCNHGGHVNVIPGQQQVSIGGGFVLRLVDLMGATIGGCPQVGPGLKPCTTVAEVLPVSVAPAVLAAGQPVLLQTLMAQTDGNPPGVVMAMAPGQAKVQAML